MKKMVIVGVGGFFAPVLMLVGWNLLQRRIFEREQLEREFDVKFVAEVASLPSRPLVPKPGSARAYQLQTHLFQESINALRVTMTSDEDINKLQVFVLASAVSGEGKTNLSSQLAMSWAQANHGRVVIVDADLRKSSLHRLFDVRPSPGLCEILRGEATIEESLIHDWGGYLAVIPGGNAHARSPANLFAGSKFQDFLAELRQHFDKIIIDVPPILCASEALLIAKAADGVLICARHDYSHSGQIKHAYDRMQAAGVNIVGAVLNGTPVHRYSYYYRGYAPA
ncbi:MAG: CpsD/CapB family tyrosine-protein kinase [Planctomycetes bacterium]|nr:CpsD/CapB family tyrosine-protein kinase [Planctomycetota bacterium]